MRDLDMSLVRKLILVDVSHSSRIGPLAELSRRKDIKLVIYDHHSPSDSDLKASRTHIKPYGAVTTLMLKLLRRKRIQISKMEATIMAMGIYEDTGFLTYRTTTPEDARQVAYLLKCGADLSLVSNFLKRELTPEQLSLLNELISNARRHVVKGVQVVISQADRDDFVNDAAAVVHKQVDLERYLVYIAVMRMGEKVHVIGRSRHHRVDIGKIISGLGGGGHSTAASAAISGKPSVEVVETILLLLEDTVAPSFSAFDIMNPNLHTIPAETTIPDARKRIVELNINSLPVTDGELIIGFVTRQQLDRAAVHRLKGIVSEVMNPDLLILPGNTSVDEVEEKLMEGTQRFVLIGSGPDRISGIITRMDLFRRLYVEKRDSKDRVRIDPDSTPRVTNLSDMLRKRADARVLEALELASKVAQESGEKVYLVGGIVRDLILNYPNKDVDLVAAENGIEFAKQMAEVGNGYTRTHDRFGTAVVIFPDGFRVDVATARSESYPSPGALPRVQIGSLRVDLFRRDFTINTLVISLIPSEFGRLIDYFGGMRDIRNRKIRTLHGLSFIDDPTRILRAIRFANKLSFDIAYGTKQLLESAVQKGMLKRISGKRTHTELALIFDDPRPLHAAELLEQHGVLKSLHRSIKLDRFTSDLIRKVDATLSWFKINYLKGSPSRILLFYMVLFEKTRANERSKLCRKLHLDGRMTKVLVEYKSHVRDALRLFNRKEKAVPSEITCLFDPMPLETVLFFHAFANQDYMKHEAVNYLTQYSSIKPLLSGKDLLEMGLKQGPLFSEIIHRLRCARLDGRVKNRADEAELVKREFISKT